MSSTVLFIHLKPAFPSVPSLRTGKLLSSSHSGPNPWLCSFTLTFTQTLFCTFQQTLCALLYKYFQNLINYFEFCCYHLFQDTMVSCLDYWNFLHIYIILPSITSSLYCCWNHQTMAKNRNTNQWDSIEIPEIDPHNYGQ